MTNSTPESQARYALAYGSADDLTSDAARAEYARLKTGRGPIEVPASVPRMTASAPAAQTWEDDIRQTRIAVQVIAWIVCAFAVLALIGGIAEAVQLHHFLAVLTSPAA
jgi:hypothetical protein